MEIKFIATTEEKLSLVHTVLCSGLPYFGAYGFCLSVDDREYDAAEKELIGHPTLKAYNGETFTETNICREDVWTQLLRTGKAIHFEDLESDGNDSFDFTLALIEKNWDKLPGDLCVKYYPEYTGDANSDDLFMQYLSFGEVVYG